jgi:hypothetical protein
MLRDPESQSKETAEPLSLDINNNPMDDDFEEQEKRVSNLDSDDN